MPLSSVHFHRKRLQIASDQWLPLEHLQRLTGTYHNLYGYLFVPCGKLQEIFVFLQKVQRLLEACKGFFSPKGIPNERSAFSSLSVSAVKIRWLMG